MKVAVRADASVQLGSGHVMRCLTLADELAAQGGQAHFIMRELPGHLAELIEKRGHHFTLLPAAKKESADLLGSPALAPWLDVWATQDAQESERALRARGGCDLLIVDHYAIDSGWQSRMRAPGRRILVIDDLADRPHDCDLFLDQNLQEHEGRYDGLLPTACRMFLGPAYALLRPQFAAAHKTQPRRDGQVKRLLISFGGSDHEGVTLMALAAYAKLGRADLKVDVVIGAGNLQRLQIEAQCARMEGVTSHYGVSDMAALMAAADLAIGAAGVTTWERACLGLPAIVVTVAENQRPLATCAERIGILSWLGDVAKDTPERLVVALRAALAGPALLAAQSLRGRELVDGRGAGRIAKALFR